MVVLLARTAGTSSATVDTKKICMTLGTLYLENYGTKVYSDHAGFLVSTIVVFLALVGSRNTISTRNATTATADQLLCSFSTAISIS